MIDTRAIRDHLQEQRQRIERAAATAGRDPGSVGIIAVSKTHPVEAIIAAYEAGQRDFGENYVQELKAKAEQLSHFSELRWHFIGHLQSNKAKSVAPIAASVQTVSSAKLARQLAARAPGARASDVGDANAALSSESTPSTAPLDVLVEVNVAGEASKSGCSVAELPQVLDAIEREPQLRLRGLMTVPPFTEDPEGARPHFEALARLAKDHGGSGRLPELSMGMSHDAEVAVSCGATWVRIGTAIFGARPPKA